MPFRKTPKTGTPYSLVAFDPNGSERSDDPDGMNGVLSQRLLADLKASPPTNVFLFSHGWRGDLGAAIDQYDRWIDAMAQLSSDAGRMGSGFKPLWLGIHWPSEPWGDEELSGAQAFGIAAGSDANGAEDLQSAYLQRLDLVSSPEANELLRLILAEQQANAAAPKLPANVAAAYQRLAQLMNFEPQGAGAQPGNDTPPFDAEAAFQAMNNQGVAFGAITNGLLAPLRALSFWNMKRRARQIGATGVNGLVGQIQLAAPEISVHLMGHSFGTIVVSSVCGQQGAWLPRPVDSVALLESAVSLWSYADSVQGNGGPGYYNAMYRKPAIRGPVITTQSTLDSAVSKWYKAAVGFVRASPSFGDDINLVRWGSIGEYGIQGIADVQAGTMLEVNQDYQFENGRIYNLESSQFICKGAGVGGAHSDIDGPEVAHALWQTAFASKGTNRAFAAAASAASKQPVVVPDPAPFVSAQKIAAPAPVSMPVPFGIQAETGAYLPELRPSDLQHIGRDSDASLLRQNPGESFGPVETVNTDELAQAGWGVIFSNTMKQDQAAVREALKPLLNLRQEQAGAFYHEFAADTGYTADQSASDWLSDRGSALAPVNPKQGVPYYLLLIGSSQDISFDFQYDLDTYFAVGRLYFNDVSEYGRYAGNMVAYETSATIPHSKSVGIFSTRNAGDAATQMLHDSIAAPMALGTQALGTPPLAESHGYKTVARLNVKATKAALLDLLEGRADGGYPALLFTGSHGVAFKCEDPEQPAKQGALLTQDWGGPGGPVSADTYLTAAELTSSPATLGMIHYCFACYSAACPIADTYSYGPNDTPVQIAKEPIIARLPQQILLNGAQAVIGHVDRAWAYSFQSGPGTTVIQNVQDPLDRILSGRRVGDAMDIFNQRWSVLSGQLVRLLDRRQAAQASVSDVKLANSWVERDDARNYIVLGDPASRLRT